LSGGRSFYRSGPAHDSARNLSEALTVHNFIGSDDPMVQGRAILLILALAAPSLAAAQAMRVNAAENMTYGDAAALLAKSCGAEIEANCRGVNLDTTRLRECLSRNIDALSPPCQQNYLGAINAIQKRINARVTVANACRREIVKLCSGSTKETSRSVPCLTTAKGVSRNCIQAMDDAGYR
jgi:hypothetical protein